MAKVKTEGNTEHAGEGGAAQHVAVRLQADLVGRLDALTVAMAPGLPAGMRGLTRSDVLRAVIEAGLNALERRATESSTSSTT